jgi:hypothetical protein
MKFYHSYRPGVFEPIEFNKIIVEVQVNFSILWRINMIDTVESDYSIQKNVTKGIIFPFNNKSIDYF